MASAATVNSISTNSPTSSFIYSPARRLEFTFPGSTNNGWTDKKKKNSPSGIRTCRPNCKKTAADSQSSEDEENWVSKASPYEVLGVDSSRTFAEIKAAFRARVKEYHPDVRKSDGDSTAKIRRVIRAYEILSEHHESEMTERESSDPFEEPECEAFDLFINQAVCVGKGCPYSCVKRAPHAFSFDSITGTARAIPQGYGEDYPVQLAVGQCPRSCIHYVTPCQRVILEELLDSLMNSPYSSGEAAILDSLLAKAKFENNRYQKPKKQSKVSTEYVDWF